MEGRQNKGQFVRNAKCSITAAILFNEVADLSNKSTLLTIS